MSNIKTKRGFSLILLYMISFTLVPSVLFSLNNNTTDSLIEVDKNAINLNPINAPGSGPEIQPLPSSSIDGNVELRWSTMVGAESYYVYASDNNFSGVTNFSTIAPNVTRTINSYVFTGLKNGTYHFAVVAHNNDGNTSHSLSNPINVEVYMQKPVITTNNATNVEINLFTINWDADPIGVLRYHIFLANDYIVDPSGTVPNQSWNRNYPNTYTFLNLKNGTYYACILSEFPDGNVSSDNLQFNVNLTFNPVTLNPIAPNPNPAGIVLVSWLPVMGAYNYYLYRNDSNDFGNVNNSAPYQVISGTQNYYNDIITTNGSFEYAISVNYGDQNSTLSNIQNVTVAIEPANITQLPLVTNTRGDLIVSWTPAGGAIEYYVYAFNYIGYGNVSELTPNATVSGLLFTHTFPKLENGTYNVVVTAHFDGNVNMTSNEVYIDVSRLPLEKPVLNPIIPNPSPISTVTVTWLPVLQADGYFVYWTVNSFDIGTNFETLSPNATEGRISARSTLDLQSNGNYQCVIVAFSNDSGIVTNSTPSDPQNVTVQIVEIEIPVLNETPVLYPISNDTQDGRVILSWSAVNNSIGYHVYRSATHIFSLSGLTPITIYGITNWTQTIDVDGLYYYVVTAFNTVSETWFSNEQCVNVTWKPYNLRQPVLTLPSTSENGQILLTWTALPTTSEYRIYRSNGTVNDNIANVTFLATVYLDTNTINGSWTYWVIGNNGSVDSQPSVNRTVNINIASYESRLIKLTLAGGNTSDTGNIILNWDRALFTTSYYLYRSNSPIVDSPNLIPYQIIPFVTNYWPEFNLPNGTYFYALKGTNGAVNTSLSNNVNVTVFILPFSERVPVLLPFDPKIDTDGDVRVRWNLINSALMYFIYRSNTTEITNITGMTPHLNRTIGQTFVVDADLAPGFYYYCVVAFNGNEYTRMSNVENVTITDRAPDKPNIKIDSANPSLNGFIRVAWDYSAIVVNYRIYRDTTSFTDVLHKQPLATIDGTATKYDENITVNGTYYYAIVAHNAKGDTMSNVVSVVVAITINWAPELTTPADISYIVGDVDNTITWTVTDTNTSTSATYIIKRNNVEIKDGSWAAGDNISISVDGLDVGVYNYTIVVNDGYGLTATDLVVVTVNATGPSEPSFMEQYGPYLPYIGGGAVVLAILSVVLSKRKKGPIPTESGDIEEMKLDF